MQYNTFIVTFQDKSHDISRTFVSNTSVSCILSAEYECTDSDKKSKNCLKLSLSNNKREFETKLKFSKISCLKSATKPTFLLKLIDCLYPISSSQ